MGTAAVSAVHAASASGLLAGATGQGTLELEHGARNFVAHGGLAALVVDGGRGHGAVAAGEEAAALAGGSCGSGVVVVGASRGAATSEEAAAAGGGGGGVAGGSERHVGWFVCL